ncbi:MAG: hypothetical protein H6767_05850 [Candidatus Peribacteria bacterium]|nr:MAG: hypothetical protein H6767_05850 [Candidatus Peribacteria bacterium]
MGDPLPATLNPYYFNDTLAYLVDNSFTKEEVSKAGFMWRDTAISVDIPANGSIISIKDLDTYEKDTNGVWKINPEILQKVVVDEDGNYYKVIPQELEFLEKYGLPLPTKHWLDRIRDGLRI